MEQINMNEMPIEAIATLDYVNNPDRRGTGGVYRGSAMLQEMIDWEIAGSGEDMRLDALYKRYDDAWTKANLKDDFQPKIAILQLREGEENHNRRFLGMDSLNRIMHEGPNCDNYELVYVRDGVVETFHQEFFREARCNELYAEFNRDGLRPRDYYGHSLSVGDVIVFVNDFNEHHAYFVDNIGFKKLPDEFLTHTMAARIRNNLDIREEAALYEKISLCQAENGIEILGKEGEDRLFTFNSQYARIFDLADRRGMIMDMEALGFDYDFAPGESVIYWQSKTDPQNRFALESWDDVRDFVQREKQERTVKELWEKVNGAETTADVAEVEKVLRDADISNDDYNELMMALSAQSREAYRHRREDSAARQNDRPSFAAQIAEGKFPRLEYVAISDTATGWTDNGAKDYGEIPGYVRGYNIEFMHRETGEINYNGAVWVNGTIEGYYQEQMDEWGDVGYTPFETERFGGWEPTGRAVMRGYAKEEYDFEERDYYVITEGVAEEIEQMLRDNHYVLKDDFDPHRPFAENVRVQARENMTAFEQLCDRLGAKPNSEEEKVISGMVNDLIFDNFRTYTDEEIVAAVVERFNREYGGGRGEDTITFFVAEVMEFPNMGEYHEGLTLKEALDLYEQIPSERMNGSKGVGFELHDGSVYDGMQYILMQGAVVQEELINDIEHYRNSPLVQKAIQDCKDELTRRSGQEHKAPVFDVRERPQEAVYRVDGADYLYIQVSEEGYDYTLYFDDLREWDGGQLDNPDLSMEQARDEILEMHDFVPSKFEVIPVDEFEQMRDKAEQEQRASNQPKIALSGQQREIEIERSAEEPLVDISNLAFDDEGYLHFTVTADGYELEGLYRVLDPANGEDMELVGIDYGEQHPIIERQWDRIADALYDASLDRYNALIDERFEHKDRVIQAMAAAGFIYNEAESQAGRHRFDKIVDGVNNGVTLVNFAEADRWIEGYVMLADDDRLHDEYQHIMYPERYDLSKLTDNQRRIVEAFDVVGYEFDATSEVSSISGLVFGDKEKPLSYPLTFKTWEEAHDWIDSATFTRMEGGKELLDAKTKILYPEPQPVVRFEDVEGKHYEYEHDLYFVADVKDGVVYLQNVNNDYHTEIPEQRFMAKAVDVTERDRLWAENPVGESDWYYNDPERGEVFAVYFNPDSYAGGQYVQMYIPYELIREAQEASHGSTEMFFEILHERAKQELVDIDTPEFKELLEHYKNAAPDFVYEGEVTMNKLVEVAGAGNERQVPTLAKLEKRIAEIDAGAPMAMEGEREELAAVLEVVENYNLSAVQAELDARLADDGDFAMSGVGGELSKYSFYALGRAERILQEQDKVLSERTDLGEKVIAQWERENRPITAEQNALVYAAIRNKNIPLDDLADTIRQALGGRFEPMPNHYYEPNLGLSGTADELFTRARNGYIENPEALAKLQEILSSPVERKTEQAFYVGVLKEIAEDKGDQPYVFAQMKKDILDGVNPEEVQLREGLTMEVLRNRGSVVIALRDYRAEDDTSFVGGHELSEDAFLKMTAQEFTETVNAIYAYNMIEEEREEPEREREERGEEMKEAEPIMVETNMGKIPVEDYREIVAQQHGFDSYDEMYAAGVRIGNGYDKEPEVNRGEDEVQEEVTKAEILRNAEELERRERELNMEAVARESEPREIDDSLPPKDQLKQRLENGVRSVLDSEKFKNWLSTGGKLFYNNYSFQNAILIWLQKPDASHVMGYEKWKDYGRNVMQGATGAKVFVPLMANEKFKGALFRSIKSNLSDQLAKDSSLAVASYRLGSSNLEFTMNRANHAIGFKVKGVEQQIFGSDDEVKRFIDRAIIGKVPTGFTVGTVFDAKDVAAPEHLWVKSGFTKEEVVTDEKGNPIKNKRGETKIINTPERQARFQPSLDTKIVAQDPDKMQKLFEACVAASERKGVPVSLAEKSDDEVLKGGAKGYFSREVTEEKPNGFIVIDNSLEITEKCAVLLHEMGHADLHKNLDALAQKMGEEKIPRAMREVQAEAVAYSVASTFGLETDTSSFNYLAAYSRGFELQDFQKSLDVIYRESQALTADIKAELDIRGLNLDLTEKPKEMLSKETLATLSTKYLDFATEQGDKVQKALDELPSLIKQSGKNRDLVDVLKYQKANLETRRVDLDSMLTLVESLNEADTREMQEEAIGLLDSAMARVNGNDAAFEVLTERYVTISEQARGSLKAAFDKHPGKTLEAMKKDYPALAALSKPQMQYIATSKFVSRELSKLLRNDPQEFVNKVTERAAMLPKVAAKNGTFVEVSFCEQWTETPIFEQGTLCSPKIADTIVKGSEAQIQGLKAEAERQGEYFPYVKCDVTIYSPNKDGGLTALHTRLDIGDGAQTGLKDHLEQVCKRGAARKELLANFQEALTERANKSKIKVQDLSEKPQDAELTGKGIVKEGNMSREEWAEQIASAKEQTAGERAEQSAERGRSKGDPSRDRR